MLSDMYNLYPSIGAVNALRSNYPYTEFNTEYENTLWQVFSVYTIPNTSDYLKIKFNS